MKMHQFWKLYLGLGVVLLATLLLRVPSLAEPPWYDDEGIYAAVGHAILGGATPYRDILDNRTPGIYWLYAAMLMVSGYSVFFVKLVATTSLLLTQATLFHIASRLWNVKTGLVVVAALGLLASFPMLEGNTANAELFMMLPVSIGVLLMLREQAFWAGVALALAFLIKQIAAIELVACVAALLLFHPRPLRTTGTLLLGYLLPVAATAVYLALQGVLTDFMYAGFAYYFGYMQRETRIPTVLLIGKVLLLLASIAIVAWHVRGPRTAERFGYGLLALWALFALFGSLFTSRWYPHYLLQAVPPLILLIVPTVVANWNIAIQRMTQGKLLATAGLSVAWCWLFLAIYMPWPSWAKLDWSVGYYQNFALYLVSQRSPQAYNDFFDKRVNRNLALLRYFQRHAKPADKLFIWGSEPWLYALTRLREATPYVVYYQAYEMPSGQQKVMESVRRQRPDFVMWTNNRPLLPDLKTELDKNYTATLVQENAIVYRRNSALSLPPTESPPPSLSSQGR